MKAIASACHSGRKTCEAGVKSSQSPRARSTAMRLASVSAGGVDDRAAGGVGDFAGAVLGAVIDDDDVADQALGGSRHQRGKRMGEADLIVLGLEDGRDHAPYIRHAAGL